MCLNWTILKTPLATCGHTLNMPRKTRSKKEPPAKRPSPQKGATSPAASPPKHHPAMSPEKAKTPKKKKDEARMARMEAQITALTSLVTAHFTAAPTAPPDIEEEETDPPPTAAQNGAKPQRRDKAYPPPPEAAPDEPALPEQIVEALKRVDPSFRPSGGKKSASIKPHLYVPRRHRAAKASEQENIPFPQFVNGMAGMVLSMMPDQSLPAAAACRHLREAAEDHMTRTWPVVREWSKVVFERMSLGELAWDDYDEIQRERIKLCFSAPPRMSAIVPCPHFNGGNCEYDACHEEGPLSLRHICPFCYAAGGGRQHHPIFKCNSKKAYNSAPKPPFNKQLKPKPDQPAKN